MISKYSISIHKSITKTQSNSNFNFAAGYHPSLLNGDGTGVPAEWHHLARFQVSLRPAVAPKKKIPAFICSKPKRDRKVGKPGNMM